MPRQQTVSPHMLAGPFDLAPFTALTLNPHGSPTATGREGDRDYLELAAGLGHHQVGTLTEQEPALYLYEYSVHDMTIRGVVGALDLSGAAVSVPPEHQAVVPHEEVDPAHVDRLTTRMEELCLHPAPILLLHQGTEQLRTEVDRIAATPPDTDVTDNTDQRHRWWAIREEGLVHRIRTGLHSSRTLIADGHHRYSSYLQLKERYPETGWSRGLAMLVDQRSSPLWLGAVHRMVHGMSVEELRGDGFELTEVADASHPWADLSPQTLLFGERGQWYRLGVPAAAGLPVSYLHDVVLQGRPHRVSVHHALSELETQLRSDEGVAVVLPAPPFQEILRRAGEGRFLPQKATSFQPKPTVGVIMRIPSANL